MDNQSGLVCWITRSLLGPYNISLLCYEMKRMKTKIKLFRTIQTNFALLGISSHQSVQQCPFNVRNLLTIFSIGFSAISTTINLLYIASSFKEYADSVYVTSSAVLTFVIYLLFVWKMRLIFELVDDLEKTCNESEKLWMTKINIVAKRVRKEYVSGLELQSSNRIYHRIGSQVEKWTEFIISSAMKVCLPGVILPTFIISYVTYFATDLSNEDAFQLAFPHWWRCFSNDRYIIPENWFLFMCLGSHSIGKIHLCI